MSKICAIAFFPWWGTEVHATIGPVRLLPFAKGRLPGALAQMPQSDIDGVLSAYANRPGHKVKSATLLEVDDWQTGRDPGEHLPRLFLARESIGFASLASRKLFRGHFGYCCFDNFTLVVQGYRPGQADSFAFTMRRRDGGSTHMWSSDLFAFQRPLHVDSTPRTETLDEALVCMLMDPDTPSHWINAVREFNRANTDSPDIPLHVEMVMMKSAFEQLLGINEKWQSFSHALERVLPPAQTSARPATGILAQRWSDRFPSSPRRLQAWVKEFCARRGAAAHGNSFGGDPIWSDHAHLAFAATLFPLVLKKLAAESGLYSMLDEDLDHLARIEQYLEHDPFDYRDGDEDGGQQHPWVEIASDIRLRAISRRTSSPVKLEKGLSASLAEEQAR